LCLGGAFFFGGTAPFALLILLAVPPPAAQATGDRVDRLIEAIQNRYSSMRSFRAGFVQYYHSGVSEEQESGILLMKKPGKMRWEYQAPTVKLFLSDGRKTYFYVPRDRQVTISTLETDSASTPLLFLLGQGNLKKDFSAAETRKDAPMAGGDMVLQLTAVREQTSFKEVFLEVKEGNADIVRISVVEHTGNRNDYVLKGLQPNVPLGDDQFRFKIPKGVEVIQQ
jgi:outer membrane lipoprotein carrier protein